MKMPKNPNLPQELLIEIFSRLPAKSVGKCRCLSKSWRYNLSTSQFINLNVTRIAHQQNLILISKSHSLKTITFPIQNNNAVSKKLELQEDTWTRVLGSCNGFVLLANKKRNLCLVNPLTTQKVWIPVFDLALKKGHKYTIHGFCYDTCTDDYKIVAIPTYVDTSSSSMIEPSPSDKYVDVYSVRKGVWNRVYSYPTVYAHTGLLKGAFHWLVMINDYEFIIAAFDFANEVFYEIPIPSTIEVLDLLCVLDILCQGSNRPDVWMMEEYGSVESWAKICTIDECEKVGIVQPICFLGDDEILLTNIYEQSWILYNAREGTVKEPVVDGIPAISWMGVSISRASSHLANKCGFC